MQNDERVCHENGREGRWKTGEIGARAKGCHSSIWRTECVLGVKFLIMKKLAASCLLSLAALHFAQAQTLTYPFPTENAYWHTVLDCGVAYEMDAFSCEETLIAGKTYRQLYHRLKRPGLDKTYYDGGYRVQGEKVFFRRSAQTLEVLLYDFSMQVGDSARLFRCFSDVDPSTGSICGAPYYRVEKIDSIQLPDGWRKRWQVKSKDDQETWIEGIGATSSPLYRLSCFFNQTAEMGCFWHQGKAVYVADTSQACEVIFQPNCWVTVSTEEPEGEVAAIHPNPFSESLTVSFSKEMPNTTHLRVFDVLGKDWAVSQEKTSNALVLQRGNLPPGIYFLKIEGGAPLPLLRVVAR